MVLWHAVQTHSIKAFFCLFFSARITRCLTWVRDMTWSCSHSEVASKKKAKRESSRNRRRHINLSVYPERGNTVVATLLTVVCGSSCKHDSCMGSLTHFWNKRTFLYHSTNVHEASVHNSLHLLQHCCWYVIWIHLFPDWFCSSYYVVNICRSVPGNRDYQIDRALNQKFYIIWKSTQSLDTASSAKTYFRPFCHFVTLLPAGCVSRDPLCSLTHWC